MQIHLAQNRNDLALKEVSAARRWAQDNLLVNLAEAWVGIRLVSDLSPPPRTQASRHHLSSCTVTASIASMSGS